MKIRGGKRHRENEVKYSFAIFLKASTNTTRTLMDVNTHSHSHTHTVRGFYFMTIAQLGVCMCVFAVYDPVRWISDFGSGSVL